MKLQLIIYSLRWASVGYVTPYVNFLERQQWDRSLAPICSFGIIRRLTRISGNTCRIA